MPYLLRFATEHVYDSTLEGITLEVFLNAGGGEPVRLRAKVDTGASDCVFERQYADLLGLAVEEGERRVFSTAAGRFLAFGHEVSVDVLGQVRHRNRLRTRGAQ
jgi:Aspartyl protease